MICGDPISPEEPKPWKTHGICERVEAEAGAEMGMDIKTYREREARHEGQLRIVGHIEL